MSKCIGEGPCEERILATWTFDCGCSGTYVWTRMRMTEDYHGHWVNFMFARCSRCHESDPRISHDAGSHLLTSLASVAAYSKRDAKYHPLYCDRPAIASILEAESRHYAQLSREAFTGDKGLK